MASTFWAELYFRSLKTSSVFLILTKYLLRHKTLCIPHVGRFDIVQMPAQLNVADKQVVPPFYRTAFSSNDEVPKLQLERMTAGREEDVSSVLFAFGEKLRRQIQKKPVLWNGLGTFSFQPGQINFAPDTISIAALQPIPAQKVIRENVQHQVLVGDREITSDGTNDIVARARRKRPWYITAGWIVLAAAIAGVAIFLYLKHFQTTSTGMQVRW